MLLNFYQNEKTEAGCDEAGRGCLAGPVFAAAVILPADFHHPLLNDSKKINAETRQLLRSFIEANAICYAVASVCHQEIDRINILKASFKAMQLAVAALSTPAEYLIIDGNRFSGYNNIPHTCIVKGDGKYASIAAASILAKTYRDDYMKQIHAEFPQYGWENNKGYGTIAHRKAIQSTGLSPYHRKTFQWSAPPELAFEGGLL